MGECSLLLAERGEREAKCGEERERGGETRRECAGRQDRQRSAVQCVIVSALSTSSLLSLSRSVSFCYRYLFFFSLLSVRHRVYQPASQPDISAAMQVTESPSSPPSSTFDTEFEVSWVLSMAEPAVC